MGTGFLSRQSVLKVGERNMVKVPVAHPDGCPSSSSTSLQSLYMASAHFLCTLWPCPFSAPDPPPPYICLVPSASRLGSTMQQTLRTQECIFSSALNTRSTLRPYKLPPSQMAGLSTHSKGAGLYFSQALQLHRSTHFSISPWSVGHIHP